MIDLYCERAAGGLLAEPVNTLTSLAFVIAAWRASIDLRASGAAPAGSQLLVPLMAAIGGGSVLFHMFASPWARLFDVGPILLFQAVFLWLYARRVADLPASTSWIAAAALVAAAIAGSRHPDVLNGSALYLPALVLLAGVALHDARRERRPGVLAAAAIIFSVSVAVRSIDLAVCDVFPVGTHFLWHLLNAVVLLLVVRGLVASGRAVPLASRNRG